MKRLWFLILLFFSVNAYAGQLIVGQGGLGQTLGAPTCTTVAQSEATPGDGSMGIAKYSSEDWFATKFQASTTASDYCGVSVYLTATLSPDGNLTVYVYDNSCTTCDRSDDEPGSQVANAASASIAAGSVASGDWTKFSMGSNFSLTSGSWYWVVVHKDTNSTTDYFSWEYEGDATTEDVKRSGDGATWASKSSTVGNLYKLYR